jgi:hypothetical protein
METKENWINKTLESLDDVNRAESDPLLFNKALQRIQYGKPTIISIRSSMIWRVAALILVLISFNVITMVYFTKTPGDSQINVKSVANEYFSYIDSINL